MRVPNDDDKAKTTKVSVDIDPDYKLGDVDIASVPGWTATMTKKKLHEGGSD